MSDPMTNMNKNEDVLASIRRLVADSQKARVSLAQQARNGEPANEGATPAELFLLTSDFRVERKASTPEPRTQNAAPSPDDADAPAASNVAPLILRPELEVAQTPESEPTEHAEQADAAEAHTAHDDALEAASQDHAEVAVTEVSEAAEEALTQSDAPAVEAWDAGDWESGDWDAKLDDTPDAQAAEHVESLSLEERIAELEVAVGAHEGEWEPDGSENLDAEIPREVPKGFAQAHPASEDASQDDVSEDAWDDTLNGEQHAAPKGEQSDEQSGEMPQDVSAAEEAASEAPQELRADETDAAPLPEAAFVSQVQDDPAGIIDEAELRAVVADVLGEELRGPLGERMTRNIRRLVKREVARALAMRDLR